jgi:hypothetical protein
MGTQSRSFGSITLGDNFAVGKMELGRCGTSTISRPFDSPPFVGKSTQIAEGTFEMLAHERLVKGRTQGRDELTRGKVDGREVDDSIAQPVDIGGETARLHLALMVGSLEGGMGLRRQRLGEQGFGEQGLRPLGRHFVRTNGTIPLAGCGGGLDQSELRPADAGTQLHKSLARQDISRNR